MNQQIKAIGRQAGLVFIEHGVYGQRWYSSRCGLDVSEYQKLVELIVRECAAICQDLDGESNTDAKSARQDCAVEIRQHFGVE